MRLDAGEESVHPGVIGRRAETVGDLNRVQVFCVGRTVANHDRVWARHQTVSGQARRRGETAWTGTDWCGPAGARPDVEVRVLTDYDAATGRWRDGYLETSSWPPCCKSEISAWESHSGGGCIRPRPLPQRGYPDSRSTCTAEDASALTAHSVAVCRACADSSAPSCEAVAAALHRLPTVVCHAATLADRGASVVASARGPPPVVSVRGRAPCA